MDSQNEPEETEALLQPSATNSPAIMKTTQQAANTFSVIGGRLMFIDFWPICLNADEDFKLVQFERFDTLLPRANAWLRQHAKVELVKCETVCRNLGCINDLSDQSLKFECKPDTNQDVYILHGLRLWYTCQLLALPGQKYRNHALQVGYRNILPRCVDDSQKHPLFEDLAGMYSTMNDDLIDKPLEGKILTIETVSVRPDRVEWTGPDIEIDKTIWPLALKQHVFYCTRIFYLFECPSYEQAGAVDFLPDFVKEPSQSTKTGHPRYANLPAIIKKMNTWLKQTQDIRIVNIQSIETPYPGRPDKVNTKANFITKIDGWPMVRFIRVHYVRPKFGLPPGGIHVPQEISHKTFVPFIVKTKQQVNQKEENESPEAFWERIRIWLSHTDCKVAGVEVLKHPIMQLNGKGNQGDAVVLKGDWCVDGEKKKEGKVQPSPVVYTIRVYFEGIVQDPGLTLIPASMSQHEMVDGCCSVA